jgi:hypothetical protein
MRNLRSPLILAALFVGFLIGVISSAYLIYFVLAPDRLLGSIAPNNLYADGQTAQFRDYYAARAASRYTALGGGAQPAALQAARDELGVTTGAVTPLQAVEMVRAAQVLATSENAGEPNPEGGRFTLADQQNLAALADKLDAVKAEPIPTAADFGGRLTLFRILGAVGLIVLSAILVGLFGLIDLWMRQGAAAQAAVAMPTRSARQAYQREEIEDDRAAGAIDDDAELNGNDGGDDDFVPANPAHAPDHGERNRLHETSETAIESDFVRAAPVAAAAEREQLIGTFRTAYEIGDDRYDESFPINGQMGELIGECGASVVERIGHEAPAKVAAIAVWLFDKSDFQSTTKVLMTDYAFQDHMIKDRLKNRGDARRAENGMLQILTSTMRVEVQISEIDFAPVGNQPHGFFEKVNLEFRVFRKML